ncbi:MAG: tetratricopeptide repeat protein, partial [Planctomycetaceae bacterium]|nr:tetratricopeptide repeat protein [Planctomycetaceae bacterium]
RRWMTFVAILLLVVVLGRLVFEAGLWRAAAALERRDHPRACTWLWSIGWLNPWSAEWHYLQARTSRRLGNFPLVEYHLKRAHELGWPAEQLAFEQELALMQTRQWDQMSTSWGDLFQRAGSDGPEVYDSFVSQQVKRLAVNQLGPVIESWKQDYPGDPQPYFFEGRISEVRLEWGAAEQAYQHALELAPEREDIRERLVLAQLKLGQLESALEQLGQFGSPPTPERLLYRAEAFSRLQRPVEAQAVLNEVLAMQPGHLPAVKQLAQLIFDQGQFEQVVAMLEPLLAEASEDHELRSLYARSLQRTGRADAAIPHLEFVRKASESLMQLGPLMELVTADPNDEAARLKVALINYRYKSRAEGVIWLRQLLEVFPNNQEARRTLVEYYESIGETANASEHRRWLRPDVPENVTADEPSTDSEGSD